MKKLFLLPLLLLSFAQAETIQCTVIDVIDGNNIACKINNKEQIKVKLYGIDAPEPGQKYSQKSKEYLSQLLLDRDIEIEVHSINKLNQKIGTVYIRSMCSCYPSDHPLSYRNASDDCGCKYDQNIEMIRKGNAWFDVSIGSNSEYQKAQEEAKKAKRGLWAKPNPIPPWIYYQMIRQKSKKQADSILEEYRRNNP